MPTLRRRSRDNTPYTPQSKAIRTCHACGESSSIRRTVCDSCGQSLKKWTGRKKAVVKRGSFESMSTGNSPDQTMDTSMDDREAATTAEEGSVASSPHSHNPHTSHQSPPTHTPSTLSDGHSTTSALSLSAEADADTHTVTSTQNGTDPQLTHPPHPNGTSFVSPPTRDSHASPPTHESQPTSPPTSQDSPTTSPPPPDFFVALGMKPSTSQQHVPSVLRPAHTSARTSSISGDSTGEGVLGGVGGAPLDVEMETDNRESSLRERYNKDPGEVLDLLKSALSLERLSQLLNSEQATSTEQLELLQGKLDTAYKTLKHCSEHKASLTQSISETNEKIKGKRRHLQSLREDLRALGEEEMALKKRRDSAHTRAAQLKQKLKASREALQQISALEKNDSTVHSKDSS